MKVGSEQGAAGGAEIHVGNGCFRFCVMALCVALECGLLAPVLLAERGR